MIWRRLLERLRRSFTTWPRLGHWMEAALLLALVAAIAVPVGMRTGFLKPGLTSDPLWKIAVFSAAAFFVPSLFEETIYRSLLLPHPTECWSLRAKLVSLNVSVVLFIAGHPLTAWLILPSWRELSYNGVFLALCGVYGVATSIVYLRSGSIWTSAAMHWVAVVAWYVGFGGSISVLGSPSP